MPPPSRCPGSGPSSPQARCERKLPSLSEDKSETASGEPPSAEAAASTPLLRSGYSTAQTRAPRPGWRAASSAEQSLASAPAGRGRAAAGRADWPDWLATHAPALPGGPRGLALSPPRTPDLAGCCHRCTPGASPERLAVATTHQVLGKALLSE